MLSDENKGEVCSHSSCLCSFILTLKKAYTNHVTIKACKSLLKYINIEGVREREERGGRGEGEVRGGRGRGEV